MMPLMLFAVIKLASKNNLSRNSPPLHPLPPPAPPTSSQFGKCLNREIFLNVKTHYSRHIFQFSNKNGSIAIGVLLLAG